MKPFTQNDLKTTEGEFDKLQGFLKEIKLEADMAAAEFYCGGHSPEDVEYAQSYDEMICAEFGVSYTNNIINDTQEKIKAMKWIKVLSQSVRMANRDQYRAYPRYGPA